MGPEKQRSRQEAAVRDKSPLLGDNPPSYGGCSLQILVEVLKK